VVLAGAVQDIRQVRGLKQWATPLAQQVGQYQERGQATKQILRSADRQEVVKHVSQCRRTPMPCCFSCFTHSCKLLYQPLTLDPWLYCIGVLYIVDACTPCC
jgi:hypothetical protein